MSGTDVYRIHKQRNTYPPASAASQSVDSGEAEPDRREPEFVKRDDEEQNSQGASDAGDLSEVCAEQSEGDREIHTSSPIRALSNSRGQDSGNATMDSVLTGGPSQLRAQASSEQEGMAIAGELKVENTRTQETLSGGGELSNTGVQTYSYEGQSQEIVETLEWLGAVIVDLEDTHFSSAERWACVVLLCLRLPLARSFLHEAYPIVMGSEV